MPPKPPGRYLTTFRCVRAAAITDLLACLVAWVGYNSNRRMEIGWQLILLNETGIVALLLMFPLLLFAGAFSFPRQGPLFAQALSLLILTFICIGAAFPPLS